MIDDDVHEFEFNEKFQVIETPFPLREMPPHVINDLSTDQNYSYRVARMLITGEIDWDLIHLMIGKLTHSRWGTTANRLARLWMSKHGLTGEDYQNLRAIVTVCVCLTFHMWFEIKTDSSIITGPYHKFREIQIIQRLKGRDAKSKQAREIAKKFIEKGSWHAHTEHLILSLLSSANEDERRFAVSKILAIRNGAEIGDSSPRPFIPPKLNWKATSIRDMQDWSDAYEPLTTASIPSNQLSQFFDTPLNFPKIPSHTQSCERAVKEVTAASANVFGAERRDGFIRARMHSRQLMPTMETKEHLSAMIQ